MKIKYLFYFLLMIAFTVTMIWNEQKNPCQNTCNQAAKTNTQQTLNADPHAFPSDWMAMQRMYPYGEMNPEAYREEMQKAAKLQNAASTRFEWGQAGPENIGGRVTDIVVHPDNQDIIYVAAATGGILKTMNGGQTWDNIFDDHAIITMGDIALDPNNPEIIYAGTGEPNSSSFNFIGDGIHKSEDGGATWQYLGLENSAYIGRIVVDYNNSDRVFVAASGYLFTNNPDRGVYRSTNGGQSWDRVLFLTDSTAAIDLVQHPENPDILFAAMWERRRGLNYRRSFGNSSGLWKTTDGGDNWVELTNGLPTGNDVGRIGVDIARSNPDVMYAFYDRQNEVAVYKSVDQGDIWTSTNDNDIQGMNSNFGWYFGQIRVDPNDKDQFYIMGVELYKSANAGNSYIGLAGYWNSWEIHVDHHAMYIDPTTGRIFEGNDGGLYYSDDEGNSWTKINNLALTQFYHIEIDYSNPQRIYGGTQDNNTIRTLTGNTDDWQAILGGDGMYTRVDYTNSNTVYAESQWGNLYRSNDLGNNFNYISSYFENDRKNWSSPYMLSPDDPSILYFGTYRLWKGTNYGNNWTTISGDLTLGDDGSTFHTIATLDVSPHNPELLLTGSDDGLVYISLNDGDTWQNISDGLPQRSITSIVFDPFDENTIYTTVSGFRWDEHAPHVFKSVNLGVDWTDISGNLPEIPVNELVCDPGIPDRLIVATDGGIFMTPDGGMEWFGISSGMPITACVTMQIHEPTRDLVVGTYGNSCYRINLDDLTVGIETPKPVIIGNSDLIVKPNPVSDVATISVKLEQGGYVSIKLYTVDGNLVSTIFNGQLQKGENNIDFNIHAAVMEQCHDGVYICRLHVGKTQKSTKIIIKK